MFQIKNEFKNANIARTVRFTDSIFAQLNDAAQKNDISFNLLVLQCCKYALENTDDEKAAEPAETDQSKGAIV